MRAAEEADLLLAIGSSLSVYPVAAAVPLAKSSGSRVIILNAQPTPMDPLADLVLRSPIRRGVAGDGEGVSAEC